MITSTLGRAIRTGISSLMLHKLRSLLTTLGVLFGTSSVIAMLAIGEGASEEAQEQIRQLGSQNVILRSVKPPEDFASNQTSRVISYGLEREDLARVRETFPAVESITALREISQEVRRGDRVLNPRVLAVEPVYREVTGRILLEGRYRIEDVRHRTKVRSAVLRNLITDLRAAGIELAVPVVDLRK